MLALAGCSAEPSQESDAVPEQGEVTAGEPPAMVETMPVAEETPTASAPAVPTEEGRPPEKRSEEHTSELQSLMRISYAVFCLKKNNKQQNTPKHDKQQN